jgi:hypothetical protein
VEWAVRHWRRGGEVDGGGWGCPRLAQEAVACTSQHIIHQLGWDKLSQRNEQGMDE